MTAAGDRPRVRPTRVEVDLDAVTANVRRLRELAAPAEVCAVVKADGYGHGAVAVGRAARRAGAAWLGVALVEEGEQLRAAGDDGPILVLAEPPPEGVERLLAAELTPPLYSPAFARALHDAGRARGRPVDVHLKADTGMHRVGIPEPDWPDVLADVAALDGLRVTALWTHLARADEPGVETTSRQLESFARFRSAAADAGLRPELAHAANSAATLLHPQARLDLVRPGIAVYGLSPAAGVDAADHGLRQALRFVTQVSYVKRVPAGAAVSYGHRWTAERDGWLATLPVGYADGVVRSLGNRVEVLVGGVRRPLVGTVCMDQLLVWCGDDEIAPGDEAVLLGAQGGDLVRVEEWAAAAGTITYEIATNLTARVPVHPQGGR